MMNCNNVNDLNIINWMIFSKNWMVGFLLKALFVNILFSEEVYLPNSNVRIPRDEKIKNIYTYVQNI